MKQPNIIFIVTDQHALHAVSCYGAPVCQTSQIDSLAADGVRFTRAYTPCALCAPARASLLTGLYPHHHGALFNSGCHLPFTEKQIGRDLAMYPAALRARGYALGYAGKWHGALAERAMDVGFEGFGPAGYGNPRVSDEYRAYLQRQGLAVPRRVVEWDAENETLPAEPGNGSGYIDAPSAAAPCMFLADTAMNLVAKFAGRSAPFLVALNFWGPHAPYTPALEFKDRYDPRSIRPWASFRDQLEGRPWAHRQHRHAVFPQAARADWETWAKVVARYYEQTTMIDAAIGRLLDHLKRRGLYDDALIVFTADHGETCGIHGGVFDKGAMAYEELYHVPLVVKLPGNQQAGTTRNALVSLLDLPNTFCEAAGTRLPPNDGASLWPILRDPQRRGRDCLVAEFHGHRLLAGQRILWWQNYKYVFNMADLDEWYDLEADPAELTNLVRQPPPGRILPELRARLWAEMQRSGDTLGPEARYFFERPLDPGASGAGT